MADTDATNITALRTSPAKGEVRRRDATAAVRARRYRKRKRVTDTVTRPDNQASAVTRRSFEKPNDFKGRVTVGRDTVKAKSDKIVTRPAHLTWQLADVTAYAAAMALGGAAAFFSIKGMVVLFPGAPLAVVGMAVAMEAAKLVTAGWLARRWRLTAWVWRLTLVALVIGLAVINATGVYAQLVAAHVGERGAATSAIETQDAALAARIEVAAHAVGDLDRRLGQIDSAIEEAAKRGRTTTELTAIEAQRKSREALAGQRQREASTLADLKAECAALGAKARKIQTEAAPIRYVAALIGADTNSERAIRWLILLRVLPCDPLTIALTAAASVLRCPDAHSNLSL